MHKLLYLFILKFILVGGYAQTAPPPPPPCTAAEASQFDFWLGNWDLTWNDTSRGSNTVVKILGSCVLQENFHDPKVKYSGLSWSMYSPQRKVWQQTWVDNAGAYIALTGGMKDGKMILSTEPKAMADEKKMISRMVFSNITTDSFEWVWEASTDEGVTWVANWKILYKRKKG